MKLPVRSIDKPVKKPFLGGFRRSRRGTTAALGGAAAAHVLVSLPQRDVTLVFGMSWHTILGSQLVQEARHRAAAAGATHLVHADMQAESVGTIRLSRAHRSGHAGRLYSAAQLFARLHPRGVAIACLTLPGGATWVGAVRDGTVLARTDVVYASVSEAEAAVDSLLAQEPDSICYGQILARRVQPLDLDMLAGDLPAQALLQLRPRAWTAVPRSLIFLLVLCVAVPLGQRGWQTYQAKQRQVLEAQRAATRLDPATAWRERYTQHLAGVTLLAHEDLPQALETLAQVPLNVAGWRFDGARCEPALQTGWSCEAIYQRGMQSASNAGFASSASSGWRMLWAPFDQVMPTFTSNLPPRPLTLSALVPLSQQNLNVVSRLQVLRAAFGNAEIGPAEIVEVGQPQELDGTGITRPGDAPVLSRRRIRLSGPMRSLYALAAAEGPYRWSRLTLAVQPSSRPTLKLSALMATLEGVLYAYGD
ncbi:type 4b pilus protein PilO2 [Pigmentiphaga aceris]|uniref:Type 4b pilus protein PilO2 n=1 Tax=Pigmentiphaga aceris TaxID=1940612 RepID=A0A5C0AZX2_9BURK|nr:type 4b pilus protein PilO2 [Pigmentiphaga aceris]QEI07725.1 type 4b pilus protein PilO2 [Pigmentiphaga aceris]